MKTLVLHCYSSRVAVYCKMRVYLLPRYDYSVTTWKHVHAFIQDYCRFVWDTNAREMRKIAALGVDDVEKEYAFAEGIVEGYPLKMSIAKVACYLETPNVRVCAHSPIESLIGKERNATTSHFCKRLRRGTHP